MQAQALIQQPDLGGAVRRDPRGRVSTSVKPSAANAVAKAAAVVAVPAPGARAVTSPIRSINRCGPWVSCRWVNRKMPPGWLIGLPLLSLRPGTSLMVTVVVVPTGRPVGWDVMSREATLTRPSRMSFSGSVVPCGTLSPKMAVVLPRLPVFLAVPPKIV